MNVDQWQKLEQIFHAALECDTNARAEFLQTACGQDRELRREVESLLAQAESAKSFLESRSREPGMKLPLGKRVGSYQIQLLLGTGGMGEVYRAHDQKLGREVALKMLPKEFSCDPERLARFRREARTLALLNHPNIAAIYGLEESDEQVCLILELVDGETLRAPLPVENALTAASQIADALGAAHAKGIIHRDLKPANIKVTPEGRVKVLDFGLAKAISVSDVRPDRWPAQNLMDLGTLAGPIVGTVGYMSPEQARGQEVDQRTDIWAFGCLLYELLAGKRAFTGKTFHETVEDLLNREPDWGSLPTKTPAKIRELLKRCLQKDVAHRLPAIADARSTIEEALHRHNRRPFAAIPFVIAAVCIAVALIKVRQPGISDPAKWVQLTRLPDSVNQPALSPDGRVLVFLRGSNTFVGESELYSKLLPDGEPVQLTHDKTRKMSPAFSPDGSRIAYTVLGQNGGWDTWSVSTLGSAPELWLPNAAALTWAGPKQILFSEIKSGYHMGIVTADVGRNESRDVYLPIHQFGMAHRSYLSPDRRWVLIVEMNQVSYWTPCRLAPYDGSSQGRQVGPPGTCTNAAWSPDGKWMFFSAAAPNEQFHIWRQRFPDGKPEQITNGPTQEEGIAVSSDGRSLITAVAFRQRPVWYHDNSGDHEISIEGYGSTPRLDFKARKLYYRVNKGQSATRAGGQLNATDLNSGHSESVTPGFDVLGFDISRDGRLAVAARDSKGKSRLWVGHLDSPASLHQIPGIESTWVLLKPSSGLLFIASEGDNQFLFEAHEDGSGLRRVSDDPVNETYSVSPDGDWVSGLGPLTGPRGGQLTFAYSTKGRQPVPLCSPPCRPYFAPDGRFLYLGIPEGWMSGAGMGHTYVLPTQPGSVFPKLPPGGFKSEAEIAAVRGVRIIDASDLGTGPSPEIYSFSREIVQRNLFRIPVP